MEQNQPIEGMTIDQAVSVLVSELPTAVKRFVTSSSRDQIIAAIAQKYQLRTDQAGELQRAFIYMLLGVSSPQEFTMDLQESGIPNETISEIILEVNNQVFIPLRNEEEEAAKKQPMLPPPAIGVQQPAPPAPIKVAAPQPPAPPMPRPAAPAPVNLPGTMPAVPAPMQSSAPAPAPAASQPPKPAPAAAPAANQTSKNREELHEVLKSYGVDPYREAAE